MSRAQPPRFSPPTRINHPQDPQAPQDPPKPPSWEACSHAPGLRFHTRAVNATETLHAKPQLKAMHQLHTHGGVWDAKGYFLDPKEALIRHFEPDTASNQLKKHTPVIG